MGPARARERPGPHEGPSRRWTNVNMDGNMYRPSSKISPRGPKPYMDTMDTGVTRAARGGRQSWGAPKKRWDPKGSGKGGRRSLGGPWCRRATRSRARDVRRRLGLRLLPGLLEHGLDGGAGLVEYEALQGHGPVPDERGHDLAGPLDEFGLICAQRVHHLLGHHHDVQARARHRVAELVGVQLHRVREMPPPVQGVHHGRQVAVIDGAALRWHGELLDVLECSP
eukprot:9494815-Pyramimonas_sp.AAC.1